MFQVTAHTDTHTKSVKADTSEENMQLSGANKTDVELKNKNIFSCLGEIFMVKKNRMTNSHANYSFAYKPIFISLSAIVIG